MERSDGSGRSDDVSILSDENSAGMAPLNRLFPVSALFTIHRKDRSHHFSISVTDVRGDFEDLAGTPAHHILAGDPQIHEKVNEAINSRGSVIHLITKPGTENQIELNLLALGENSLFLGVRERKEIRSKGDLADPDALDKELLLSHMINAYIVWESVFDGNGNYISFRFGPFNDAYSKISGLNYEDVKGKDVFEVWPDTEQSWVEIYGSVADTGRPKTFEMYHRPTDGWYICNAYRPQESRNRVCVIFEDITERKREELILSKEKENLAVTLRSIGDGVITTDIQGTVVMLNRSAEKMTGWEDSEARGKPLTDIFHIINHQTREPCENPVEKILSTDKVIELENHTCLISKDGFEIIIEDSGAPIHNRDSEIVGTVLVFRDITEKHKLNELMLKTQQLESLGLLAGGIAHDFNNLLSGIFGFLELAMKDGRSRKIRGYLSDSLASMERAKSLTHQLMNFSKGGELEKNETHLFPFIQDIVRFALSGSNVTGKVTVENNLTPKPFDRNQMAQVFENLAINAKQAMPKGGVLIVSVQTRHIDRDGALPLPPGEYVEISFADQGDGISEKHLSQIFDPYFTTKSTGHGLGLCTCYSIVAHHGGLITAESEPGEGSVFRVYLPAGNERTGDAPVKPVKVHRGKGVFIVIDDEESVREYFKISLESFGYKVITGDDGKKAADLYREECRVGRKVAGMIFDLTIPGGMGGKEAAGEIRKLTEDLPIFVTSGYSRDPVMENPAGYGFNASIDKPFSLDELSHMLEEHIN